MRTLGQGCRLYPLLHSPGPRPPNLPLWLTCLPHHLSKVLHQCRSLLSTQGTGTPPRPRRQVATCPGTALALTAPSSAPWSVPQASATGGKGLIAWPGPLGALLPLHSRSCGSTVGSPYEAWTAEWRAEGRRGVQDPMRWPHHLPS